MALRHRSINGTSRSLAELVRLVDQGGLLVDTPYQRGDVWTLPQRVNLLKSLLMGVPVPAIVVNRRGGLETWERLRADGDETWYACIDGKQRITTMCMWLHGELAIPADWVPEDQIERLNTDGTVSYTGLTKAGQRYQSRWPIPMAEGQLDTLEEEAEVYLLINRAGTAHTDAELAKAEGFAR